MFDTYGVSDDRARILEKFLWAALALHETPSDLSIAVEILVLPDHALNENETAWIEERVNPFALKPVNYDRNCMRIEILYHTLFDCFDDPNFERIGCYYLPIRRQPNENSLHSAM